MSRRRKRHTIDLAIPWRPGLAVALLATIVLGAAVGPFPVAGESAQLLDKHLGLDAMPLAVNPLWGLVVRTVAALVPWAPIAALNLFSLACGVGAVVLFYYLNARLLQLLLPGRHEHEYVFCGITAAFYLVVSTPFWMVGSRAHPLSFDLFLILLAILLQAEYQRTRQIRMLYAFGFVCGLGLIEYPVFLVLAWPLGILTLFLMRRRGHLRRSRRKKNLLSGLASTVAGMLVVLIPACWYLVRSPARLWVENPGWLRTLHRMLTANWGQVQDSLTQSGWILMGMVSVVPWVACVFETRRRATFRHVPSLLMYSVLSALPLAILFNAPFAPSAVADPGTLVVAPYLFIAGTFGLLANYWRAAITRLWDKQGWAAVWLRNGLIMILPTAVAVAPVISFPRIDTEPARVLYDCADEILEAMGDRDWLVTDGTLDSLLRLAAREQGRSIHLLDLGRARDARYRQVLASKFSEPRHQSLARMGPLALVRELLATEPGITDRLAFVNSGDLWLATGFTPVPERLVYLGRPAHDAPGDAEAALDRHLAFWERTVVRLRHTESTSDAYGPLARHLRWQASRVANDLGILLQREGAGDAAQLAYQAAHKANDLNVSALLNLGVDDESDLAEAIRDELDLPLPVLVSRYGHIHSLSDLMARSTPRDPARDVLSESIRDRFREVSEHFRSGDLERSLEAVDGILIEDPANPAAWYLRGLLGVLGGDDDVWEESWQFMSTLERPWPAFLMIRGERLLRAGQLGEGLEHYEQAYALNPLHPHIVRPVAVAEFSFGNRRKAENLVSHLLSLDPSDPWGNFALGTIQFERDEWELAESSLRVAVSGLRLPEAHNNLAWILTLNGKINEAKEQVALALSLDAEFSPAWDTLGVIQMKTGDLEDAEITFQHALALAPQDWDPRVHHAQLVLAAGRTEEATEIARALEADAAGRSPAERAEYVALRRELGLPRRDYPD